MDPSTISIANFSLGDQVAIRSWGNAASAPLYASIHNDTPCTLVLTHLLPVHSWPTTVRHHTFRHIPYTPPLLRIEAVVLPDTPLDLNSRLYHTALALLETHHLYG